MGKVPTHGVRANRSTARRWSVVGVSGAGKSTLSVRLGALLRLPVVHLDRHYWTEGWTPTPTETWRVKVRALAQVDAWVMDGNYSGSFAERLPFIDVVVLLDLPPWLCAFRVLRRRLARTPRPDVPDGCVERFRWSDVQWLWWILTYRRRSRPKILSLVARRPEVALIVLRSDREVAAFLEALSDVT